MPAARDLTFQLERFEWIASDRLELAGRWEGLGGRRLGRPVLAFQSDGRRHRLPAMPGRRLGADDGWRAAFAWDGGPVAIDRAELEIGRSLVVDLPAPRRRRSRERGERPAVATGDADAVGARLAAAEERLEAERDESERRLERAHRDTEAVRAQLLRRREEYEGMREQLLAELAERHREVARLRDDLSAAAEETETVLAGERERAARERDEALARERERAAAELAAVRADLDARDGELAALRADLDARDGELAALRADFERARAEADELHERVHEAQERLLAAPAPGEEDTRPPATGSGAEDARPVEPAAPGEESARPPATGSGAEDARPVGPAAPEEDTRPVESVAPEDHTRPLEPAAHPEDTQPVEPAGGPQGSRRERVPGAKTPLGRQHAPGRDDTRPLEPSHARAAAPPAEERANGGASTDTVQTTPVARAPEGEGGSTRTLEVPGLEAVRERGARVLSTLLGRTARGGGDRSLPGQTTRGGGGDRSLPGQTTRGDEHERERAPDRLGRPGGAADEQSRRTPARRTAARPVTRSRSTSTTARSRARPRTARQHSREVLWAMRIAAVAVLLVFLVLLAVVLDVVS